MEGGNSENETLHMGERWRMMEVYKNCDSVTNKNAKKRNKLALYKLVSGQGACRVSATVVTTREHKSARRAEFAGQLI